jgi:hypothetical protein
MQDEEYLQNNKFESFEMDAYECWFEILNKDPDNELKVSWKWIWDVWIFKDTVVNHSLLKFIQSNVNWKTSVCHYLGTL